jgi:Tfp pilus assembly protein FimT
VHRRSKHTFMLNELIVVIDIIALLTATLFPVFAQAREKGRLRCILLISGPGKR